jgi:hypothetical protein
MVPTKGNVSEMAFPLEFVLPQLGRVTARKRTLLLFILLIRRGFLENEI